MKKFIYTGLLTIFTILLPLNVAAQKEATVYGSYTYTIGDNDNITIKAAKHKCIELAKAAAIKAEFGEIVTTDVIDSHVETNGEAESSMFWENTVAMAKGEWLADTKPTAMDIKYENGKLLITAEVWGKVREIIQSQTQLKWEVYKDGKEKKEETSDFKSGERFYVNFQAPADGYLAIYLIADENETSCLLPYRKAAVGRVTIKEGKEYEFFDKNIDPRAVHYTLNPKHGLEYYQLVVIYSPNPFTKCIDKVGDARHPNSLSTREFQKWLLKCQRTDRDMVVQKKWIKVENSQSQN